MTERPNQPQSTVIARSPRDEAIQGNRTPQPRLPDLKATGNSNNTKQPAIYIAASQRNGTLYVGVTSDLVRRMSQHRTGAIPGFATRYGCRSLVYFELHADMTNAIAREKQIKAGSRARKLALIAAQNPAWHDLYETIL